MPFARSAALAAVALAVAAAGLLTAPARADDGLAGLASPSVRSPIASDTFYFVMTDRYSNGNPANDSGGKSGGPTTTGFEPTSDAFYHGGDLAGLTGRCDVTDQADTGLARLKRLGFTAVWITPPFVQQTVQGESAAYHGYWFLDITKPDPHLGTEADFAAFMACARKLEIKVFLDIVVNHTADVISYAQGDSYVPMEEVPYRTARRRAFNPWRYTTGTTFPQLSARRSFAKTPSVAPSMAHGKVPDVLNQVVRYHNRGNIDFGSCSGRCEMDGDFVGLDDLMTEDWTVVKALADAYSSWITKYGVDGFRIDTAKHVDPYFFGRWLPLVNEHASSAGKPSFTSFGEAWLTDPTQLSALMLDRRLPAVLDFPYQDAARKFVTNSSSGASLAGLFAADDYYTSSTTNAYGLTTFLGNHDMGRIGFFISTADPDAPARQLERDLLAHDLLYLTRGVPVVYYGDEAGMTGSGDGTDKQARQDMFPTQVPDWRSQERIGGQPIGEGSSFDRSTAIETRMATLARLRAENPALASGAQVTRFGGGNVFAASRIDSASRREYVVVFNSGDVAATVGFATSTPSSTWTARLGGRPTTTDATGRMTVAVPARSSIVLQADAPLPAPAAPSVTLRSSKDFPSGKYRLTASVPGADPSTVTFVMRRKGAATWTPLGADDARPFRVFVPASRANVEVAAVVKDSVGQVASSTPLPLRLVPFV